MNMMHKPERCCHDHDAGSCRQCATGSRNRYYRRKMMTAEDFRVEQAYMIGRRQLINRSVLGSGVVNGLVVKGEAAQAAPTQNPADRTALSAEPVRYTHLLIGHGLALDEHGRELIVPEDHWLCRHDLFIPGTDEQQCKPQDLCDSETGSMASFGALCRTSKSIRCGCRTPAIAPNPSGIGCARP